MRAGSWLTVGVSAILAVGCVAGPAASPDASPSILLRTSTPAATGTLGPAVSPDATASPLPPATPTASPSAVASPRPTSTPGPSPTPEPTRSLAPGETPPPTPIDISEFLTARVSLLNLSDGPVEVSVDISFPDSGESETVSTQRLAPLEFVRQSVPAADYRISIVRDGEATTSASCSVTVGEEAAYHFVVLPDDVIVVSEGREPGTWEELSMATSPLCAA